MRQPPDYDPLLLRLGGTLSTPTLLVDNTYYPWTTVNGQGRLSRINAGPLLTPTTLLNLYYTYDAVGNILTVKDHVMGSSTKVPQTQTFTYDALNRLTSASASGGLNGVGDYVLENYTYSTSTGNLTSKGILNYVYGGQAATCPDGSLSQAHAVKSIMISDNPPLHRFCYDRNGNLVQRSGTVNYTLAYDAENRLITSTAGSSSFVYDGDGNRVKATVNGVTTLYVGNYFEINVNTDAMVKYYYAGGQRIAMRNGNTTGTSGLYWLLADHLGSTNKVVNANGTLHSWQLYKAWGEWRAGSTPGLLTDYSFTGQKVVSGVGMYYYGARWYDALTHFVQPDSIIPNPYHPLDWNRYAYARSNPLKYTDPTGHMPCGRSCPGDWVNEQELNFGAAWLGDWNPAKQKANSEKIEAAIKAFAETGASILWEPADWAVTLGDGFQWYDSISFLPIISGALGRTFGRAAENILSKMPLQNHHILTNINKRWTPLFNEIVDKYEGMNINGDWNQITIPHQGRHATEYHQWTYDTLRGIDQTADGNSDVFIILFNERILQPLFENPLMLRKDWWK